jgi:hypothetical protein
MRGKKVEKDIAIDIGCVYGSFVWRVRNTKRD